MNIRINFKSKVQNFIHLPIKLHINNHIQKTYTTTINWPQTNIHKKRPHTHTKTELYPVKKHENRGPPVHIFHVCFFFIMPAAREMESLSKVARPGFTRCCAKEKLFTTSLGVLRHTTQPRRRVGTPAFTSVCVCV